MIVLFSLVPADPGKPLMEVARHLSTIYDPTIF